MNMHQHIQLPVGEAIRAAPSTRGFFRALAAKVATCAKRCADRYAAVCAYEDLSRLSDADLRIRDLNRDILARDLDR